MTTERTTVEQKLAEYRAQVESREAAITAAEDAYWEESAIYGPDAPETQRARQARDTCVGSRDDLLTAIRACERRLIRLDDDERRATALEDWHKSANQLTLAVDAVQKLEIAVIEAGRQYGRFLENARAGYATISVRGIPGEVSLPTYTRGVGDSLDERRLWLHVLETLFYASGGETPVFGMHTREGARLASAIPKSKIVSQSVGAVDAVFARLGAPDDVVAALRAALGKDGTDPSPASSKQPKPRPPRPIKASPNVNATGPEATPPEVLDPFEAA